MKPIELTTEQMVLFRVFPKEPGFSLKQPQAVVQEKKKAIEKSPRFSLSPNYDSRFSSCDNSLDYSFNSTNVNSGLDTTSKSWWYQWTAATPKHTSNTDLQTNYSLRKRITPSRLNAEPIATTASLNGYLKEYEQHQSRLDEIQRHESNSSLVSEPISLSNLSNGGRSPAKYQAADDSVLSSDNDMVVDTSSCSPSRSRDSVSRLICSEGMQPNCDLTR